MYAYLVEVGILLTKEDEEFEAYSGVYNRIYGFYDEDQYYVKEKEVAILNAKNYVEKGVENTYAIVSGTILPEDFDFENGVVEDAEYNMENVVYSVAKFNGELVENFL